MLLLCVLPSLRRLGLLVLLALANLRHVDVGAVRRRGLAETRGDTVAGGNVTGEAAAADVDVALVHGLPVGGDGGLLGERKVLAGLLDLVGLGLGRHF